MMGRNYWQRVRRAGVNTGPKQFDAGFTIVETLIVLAVTGILFVSTVGLIAGKQRQTEFDQSIQDAQSKIQQIITEVGNNYYPYNLGDFICNDGNVSVGTGLGQGTNQTCIFIGKAISFDTTDPNQHKLYVYPLVGRQTKNGVAVNNLADANPSVIADPGGVNFTNEATSYNLLYGLQLQWVKYTNSGIPPTPAATNKDIGSLALLNVGNSPTATGSNQVNVLPIDGTAITDSRSTAINAINNFFFPANLPTDANMLNPDGGVQLCFASGGTDQSGLITVGGSGRVLNANLQIKNGQAC